MCGEPWRRRVFFLAVFYLLLLVTMSGGERQEVVPVRVQMSRMGSRPPCCVCERRCGGCAPCTAVQVRAAVGTQCAGYEPVRWKCRCGDAVFDP